MSQENRNPFPGVNPYLNSNLQREGGWRGFHTQHLTDLARTIDANLLEGYYAVTEGSLQIAYPSGETVQTIPDVSIYNTGSSTPEENAPGTSTPTLALPVLENVPDENFIGSVVIYHDDQPVTRLELISPSNLTTHWTQYRYKREATSLTGLNLVEIDYLHAYPPVDPRIPGYGKQEAYPYYIAVSNPHPEGLMHVYSFGVLDALPIINVPLKNGHAVRVDFNTIYHRTFESSRIFWKIKVTQPPVDFTEADLEAIRNYKQS